MISTATHDPACRRCDRLAGYLDTTRARYPEYFCGPVPPFGIEHPALLIVGLAPGLHGANATGRPFTGDHAGLLLYRTLHAFGFASAPESHHAGDDLALFRCRITNAVKCVPPANKPLPGEVRACNGYLRTELAPMGPGSAVLALGRIAHDAVLLAAGVGRGRPAFGHGVEHVLPAGATLVASYHCSRYNTQTRRLTTEMFNDVFRRITALLGMERP